jgi:RarD protein
MLTPTPNARFSFLAAAATGQPTWPWRAVLLLLVSVALLTLMEISAKLLTAHLPVWEVVWAKYFFHLLIAPLALWSAGHLRASLRPAQPMLQLLRSGLLFGATATFFFALKHMPLVTANVIGFTSPLLTALLAVVFLKEKASAVRIGASLLAFAGVWIVVRPNPAASWSPFVLLPMATALCYAGYAVLTRRLAAQDSPYTTLLWTPAVGAVLASIAAAGEFRPPATTFDTALLVALGICSCAGHFLFIQALRRAPASMLAPFQYLQLPMALGLSFLVFAVVPDRQTWIGGALIVGSGLLLWVWEGMRPKGTASTPDATGRRSFGTWARP